MLLGDYVDRGPNSLGVLECIRNLQQEFPGRVVALLGNHDVWLLEWLDGDDDDANWLLADAGLLTTRTFVPAEVIDSIPVRSDRAHINRVLKQHVISTHGALIAWLRSLPLFHEEAHQIYVHAGVDELAGAYWKQATSDIVFTHKYPAATGTFFKDVIAGHVSTAELNEDRSRGVFHDGESHFYIDGSAEVTGHLNILRYDVDTATYSWRSVGVLSTTPTPSSVSPWARI